MTEDGLDSSKWSLIARDSTEVERFDPSVFFGVNLGSLSG